MSDYEPPAEMVEALAKELHDAGRPAYGDRLPWQAMADVWQTMVRAESRFVLRRQRERERGLLALLEGARPTIGKTDVLINDRERIAALAAHAKLDAPKVPTLRELHSAYESNQSNATMRALMAGLVGVVLRCDKAAAEGEEKR